MKKVTENPYTAICCWNRSYFCVYFLACFDSFGQFWVENSFFMKNIKTRLKIPKFTIFLKILPRLTLYFLNSTCL